MALRARGIKQRFLVVDKAEQNSGSVHQAAGIAANKDAEVCSQASANTHATATQDVLGVI